MWYSERKREIEREYYYKYSEDTQIEEAGENPVIFQSLFVKWDNRKREYIEFAYIVRRKCRAYEINSKKSFMAMPFSYKVDISVKKLKINIYAQKSLIVCNIFIINFIILK